MFEKEILNFGFIKGIGNSYRLEFKNIVFLYVESCGKIYYEYFGKDIPHSDVSRERFISLISDVIAWERNEKINRILE